MKNNPVENGNARFDSAIRRFDEENARDPHRQLVDGILQARELLHAQWLTQWVMRLKPDASEELRLAARCQHLCRWMIPRESYPMTRAGYLKWREELKKFHAQRSGEILRETGYPAAVIERVRCLVRKENLSTDADAQVLEDALCLVFLERQLSELASKTSEDKVINALRKSWNKMSAQGRTEALKLSRGPREKELIERALEQAE